MIIIDKFDRVSIDEELIFMDNIKLSDSEKQIHHYVLSHLDKVVYMTVRELAEVTFCSTTTIMRYCKKLGYTGFEDFKVHITVDVHKMDYDHFKITNKENIAIVTNKLQNLNNEVINEIQNHLSIDLLYEIRHQIEQVEHIVFICFDWNVSICEYASHYFMLAGKLCEIYSARDQMLLFSMNKKHKDSLVIVVSRSGKGKHLIKVCKNLRMNHIYYTAITGIKNSPVEKYANAIINVPYNDDFRYYGDSIFYTSVKYILDCIIFVYISDNYKTVENNVKSYNSDFFY